MLKNELRMRNSWKVLISSIYYILYIICRDDVTPTNGRLGDYNSIIKFAEVNRNMSLAERARKLKTDLPTVYLSLKDVRTPCVAKIFAAITVAYALSPIDLIPDFIPVLGYLDDVILLPALIALTIKLIPRDVWEINYKAAEGLWENEKPKKWYYAVPIVLLWILVIWYIVKVIWL